MPNPKRRHSKTRTAKRRTHDALKPDRRRASARSATSSSRRTASARTAATTAAGRSAPSTKSSKRCGLHGDSRPSPSTRWAAITLPASSSTAPSQAVRRARPGGRARRSDEADRAPSSRGIPAVDRHRLRIVDAPDVVAMDEAPLAALRRKPRASIRVAANLVASGDAQALFSAGHTGAAFLAAHAALGMIDWRRAARAGRHGADANRRGGSARRRRQRRMPARASRAVRAAGIGVRARRARPRASARRPALDRRRGRARATTSSARRTRC